MPDMTRYMKLDATLPLTMMTTYELSELLAPARNAFILQGENLYFVSNTKYIYPLLKGNESFNPQISKEQAGQILTEISSHPKAFFKSMTARGNLALAFGQMIDVRAMIIEQGKEKLDISQMTALKTELKMDEAVPIPIGETFTFNSMNWDQLNLEANNGLVSGMKNPNGIHVTVIKKNKHVLVQVGPCDLSGVGGHEKREEIIKALVNNALQKSGETLKYEDVHVSVACGVRGRLQMFLDTLNPLSNAKTKMSSSGTHMNAYIKTAGEKKVTHWEPRQGPQSFFNDTICALVISIATNHFEHQVLRRNEKGYTSEQATTEILKNKNFKSIFDTVLQRGSTAVTYVIGIVRHFKESLQDSKETASTANVIVKDPDDDIAFREAEALADDKLDDCEVSDDDSSHASIKL